MSTRDLQWPLSWHWCHQGPCVVKPYILCGHARCIDEVLMEPVCGHARCTDEVLMELVWSTWWSSCQLHGDDLCCANPYLMMWLCWLTHGRMSMIYWWNPYYVGGRPWWTCRVMDPYTEIPLHVHLAVCLWSEDQSPWCPQKPLARWRSAEGTKTRILYESMGWPWRETNSLESYVRIGIKVVMKSSYVVLLVEGSLIRLIVKICLL